jgi:superfamily I DNA and/or RNA helicase
MSYSDKIQNLQNPTFGKIADIAKKQHCSSAQCLGISICKPWNVTEHGIALLDTHEKCCKYFCAYGEMHEAKIHYALDKLTNLSEICKHKFSVIDWGCGQGLATICFFDYLKKHSIENKVQKVILIEPSDTTRERAQLHINAYLKNKNKMFAIGKYLNDVTKDDIKTDTPITLHFFSNILDVNTIDLEKLANNLKDLQGENLFICVGPMNHDSTRIDIFANHIGMSQEQIISKYDGSLTTKRGTIKMLIFSIKNKQIEIIKSDYYPTIPNNINYIIMIDKLLNKVNTTSLKDLKDLDKILLFYKIVVELEQQKEPEIKKFYPYPITENSLDLQENQEFLGEFEINRDPRTRWSKDVFIGIRGNLNNKSYVLMYYIIPFDEIKEIDVSKQKIPFSINQFSLFLKTFNDLELSEEKISEIENDVKNVSSISKIEEILQNKIDTNFKIDNNYLYLALSQKNLSLSQIYSELNKMTNSVIEKAPLLCDFLFNRTINNGCNSIQKEDLIQISNLDDSQQNAVLTSLNNRLSVITGPPGSGKTQVILNILANAVVQGKKVLVASKNNKAVDNVKERFDKVDENGFFCRFGSKQILENTTIPALESIIANIRNMEDNTKILNNLLNEREQCIETIRQGENELNRKLKLEKENIGLTQQIESNIFFDEFQIHNADQFISKIKKERNEVEMKNSGFTKLFFNWFYKSKYANILLNTIENYDPPVREYIQKQDWYRDRISDYKKAQDIIDVYSQLIAIFEKIKELKDWRVQLHSNQQEIDNINEQQWEEKITANQNNLKSEEKGIKLIQEFIKNKLKKADLTQIDNYKNYLPDSIPWRDDEIETFIRTTSSFLNVFNITCVTSLSAKNAFPLTKDLFDIVVIDEASQCDIASALPLILRTKQLVVIGDPLQLKHISMVNEYEETYIKEKLLITEFPFLKYSTKSLYDYCVDFLHQTNNNHPLMLNYHYRCHPQIIGYSNQTFYQQLGQALTIMTNPNDFTINPAGIIWIDVKGEQTSNSKNENKDEVKKAIEIIKDIANRYPKKSIGIVTPFKNQAETLNSEIPNELRDRIVADTVHKFQGDEKDVMIYSLVVTDNSPNTKIKWIDESVPNLVNVAVTRAKNTLFIIGNKEYIRANSSDTKPLGKLVNYVEELRRGDEVRS